MSRKLPIGVATTYRPGVSDMRDSPLRCCGPGCGVIVATTAPTAPTPSTPNQAPVVQRPVEPIAPTPTQTPSQEPAKEAPKDVRVTEPENTLPPQTDRVAADGVYFNNREGLTLPHMAGRDTKRLALLLPFSTSSSRLAQEAQSMYRAAEMAVFDRTGSDVLLIALDTKPHKYAAYRVLHRSDSRRTGDLSSIFPTGSRSRPHCRLCIWHGGHTLCLPRTGQCLWPPRQVCLCR